MEVRDRKDGHRNDVKDEDADDTITVKIEVFDRDEPPAAPTVTVTSRPMQRYDAGCDLG